MGLGITLEATSRIGLLLTGGGAIIPSAGCAPPHPNHLAVVLGAFQLQESTSGYLTSYPEPFNFLTKPSSEAGHHPHIDFSPAISPQSLTPLHILLL